MRFAHLPVVSFVLLSLGAASCGGRIFTDEAAGASTPPAATGEGSQPSAAAPTPPEAFTGGDGGTRSPVSADAGPAADASDVVSDSGGDSTEPSGCSGFSAMAYYDAGVEPYAVALGDYGGHGLLDIVVASNIDDSTTVGPSQILVLRNQGDGTFALDATANLSGNPYALALADFDNDGSLDVAVGLIVEPSDVPWGSVSILQNQGGSLTESPYPGGADPTAVATGDFDGDGLIDVVSADGTDGAVNLLLNNGDGTFRAGVSVPLSGAASSIVASDFNGDGRLDVAVAFQLSSFIEVLLGAPAGTFEPPVMYSVGMGPGAITLGDFNGDGHSDLAVANGTDATVSVLVGKGDGTFGPQAVLTVGGGLSSIAAADFDGNGTMDLAIADETNMQVDVLSGRGDGTFAPPARYSDESVPFRIAAGSLVNGGRQGIVVTNIDTHQVGVLLPCP